MVQQMQPLLICTICSVPSCTRMSLSMFSSPNSFSITAIFMPWCSFRMRLSSVVLPLPRKPVRMVTGIILDMMRFLSCDETPDARNPRKRP